MTVLIYLPFYSMKKVLSLVIASVFLMTGMALAHTGTDGNARVKVSSNGEMNFGRSLVKFKHGMKKEMREEQKTLKKEIRDLQKAQRAEVKSLRVECRALIEAATDENEASVKATCKARMEALHASHRTALEAKKMRLYTDMLVAFKTELTAKLSTIQGYSTEVKAKFKTHLTRQVAHLKEKATDDNNTVALSIIADIEVLIGQI